MYFEEMPASGTARHQNEHDTSVRMTPLIQMLYRSTTEFANCTSGVSPAKLGVFLLRRLALRAFLNCKNAIADRNEHGVVGDDRGRDYR